MNEQEKTIKFLRLKVQDIHTGLRFIHQLSRDNKVVQKEIESVLKDVNLTIDTLEG